MGDNYAGLGEERKYLEVGFDAAAFLAERRRQQKERGKANDPMAGLGSVTGGVDTTGFQFAKLSKPNFAGMGDDEPYTGDVSDFHFVKMRKPNYAGLDSEEGVIQSESDRMIKKSSGTVTKAHSFDNLHRHDDQCSGSCCECKEAAMQAKFSVGQVVYMNGRKSDRWRIVELGGKDALLVNEKNGWETRFAMAAGDFEAAA